ncbi:MAG: adenylosuccinate lyase [Candidatus Adiutrix sp.]
MIERYQRPIMAKLWSLENQYATWLEVELAVCQAQSEMGLIPPNVYEEIKIKAKIDPQRIAEIEEEVRHDVIAFVTQIESAVGPAARWFHFGLTSSDVLDTALALRLVRALDIILGDLDELLSTLKSRAFEFKDLPIIGRSHGIHAEPTTFGLKLAIFYDEFSRHKKRLLAAKETIAVGQCSGPVGNFSAFGINPNLEEKALATLGLTAANVSNQVIQRDRHGEYFSALALLASSMEKMAVEVRHLARTEVGEVEESFGATQKGSSAMPHKKNPIGTENISGLARLVRAASLAAMENIPLWHERDISHSSVERVIAPDATSLTDYMLVRLNAIITNLVVHPKRMEANLNLTGGLYNSQQLLLMLCEKGLSRKQAYGIVQTAALKAHHEQLDFKTILLENKELEKHLAPSEIESVFTLGRFQKATDSIFARVFKPVK